MSDMNWPGKLVEDPAQDTEWLGEEVPADDAVGTTMYDGMSFEDAIRLYEDFTKDPNVSPSKTGWDTAIYTDPETGKREMIPRPTPKTWKATGDAIIDLFTDGPKKALDTFSNPEADVSGLEKVSLGLAESAGDTAEMVAAGVDKVSDALGFETDALGAVEGVTADVDAGDRVGDALLTDAVPAALAALTGAGGAAKYLPAATTKAGNFLRALGIGLAGETAASSTVGTDEGTVLVGENPAFDTGLFRGLDLGDSKADQVLEQRFNTLLEGLALGSAAAGVTTTAVQIGKLGSQFLVEPFMTAARGSNMEKRAVERIMDQLTLVTDASTPEEIFAVRKSIADIVENNKTVVLDSLARQDEPLELTLDTVSALARGTDDATADQLASIRSGVIQRSQVGSRTQQALAGPSRSLQEETEAYLKRVGGETADDQVATMQASARAAADEVAERVDDVAGGVGVARQNYEKAVDDVVRSINDDLEVGQQIQRLEDLNGTEIVEGAATNREQVKASLETAYSGMRQTKNDLYTQIEGGPVDVGSLYDAFAQADLDELTKKRSTVSGHHPSGDPRRGH